jgi:hypothetical protein
MNPMQRPILSGVIALTMAFAMSACGRSSAVQPSPQSFESLDANHDNLIEATESDRVPALAGVFSSADANHDGSLDRQEFDRALAQLQQQAAQTGNG